ncbi:hypothetical protein OCF84_21645 (plasmid) [Shewanella xiamenensis]|uniref:Uncharacterized protein n=1 Tax=Shewanella xiamenensis TaxID=332186 RepID=A0ABT6UDH6_9GAMM|nr:hypothetical protein [Shewanella xiamenensis]MDI5832517.1 hypothetical protein [Shewanella xiamenensis]WHF57864.1 hypothetical protein OCF84_21645 [Shewanella xiamenensis]
MNKDISLVSENVDQSLFDRYQIYLASADNGAGIDITTGMPLKTYDEWLSS